jgi:hypothetical protein
MKTLLLVGLLALIAFVSPQPAPADLRGAWEGAGPDGATLRVLFVDGYASATIFGPNQFMMTFGGPYQATAETITVKQEFNSAEKEAVGQEHTSSYRLDGNTLNVTSDGNSFSLKRLDAGTGPMVGTWRITGRANEQGEVSTMQRGARKTLKLLTGGRFQWIAMNTQTGEFSGTGGGSYTAQGGKYTETIEFFSRDNSRVGKSLTFDYALDGGKWRHRGLSSTGGKVDEVWEREQ